MYIEIALWTMRAYDSTYTEKKKHIPFIPIILHWVVIVVCVCVIVCVCAFRRSFIIKMVFNILWQNN